MLHRSAKVGRGVTIVVLGAAGGVGSVLVARGTTLVSYGTGGKVVLVP